VQVFHDKRDPVSCTDQDLIRMIQTDGGSPIGRASAEELFGRYRRPVYLMCHRYVKNHDRALDISQDVLLSAYERFSRYNDTSGFSCWLFTIARNRCLNSLRSVKLWQDDGSDPEYLQDAGAGPDRIVEEKEDEERILELVRTALDPIEQRALWMRRFEKVPVDEITKLLGIESASGDRALLQKARRKLKAAIHGGRGSRHDGFFARLKGFFYAAPRVGGGRVGLDRGCGTGVVAALVERWNGISQQQRCVGRRPAGLPPGPRNDGRRRRASVLASRQYRR
jgi:RNA polymerase sigma factor (sigma-70 family)